MISFSRSVVSVHGRNGWGSASCRRKLARLWARANNWSRAWLSRNRRHDIRAEVNALGIRPLPAARTIERVLQRHALTAPRIRLAPLLPRQEYPGPQARASNQLHEVDLVVVGPVYLKGSRRRYYICVGKDAFDGAVCLRLAGSMYSTMYPINPFRKLNLGDPTPGINADLVPSTPSSFHPGGANFAFCDGSVRFLKDSIQAQTS